MKVTHFAEVLKEVLESCHTTQRSLAQRAGVSPSGVSGIIQGKRPEVETLSRLLRVVGDTPEKRRRLVAAHLHDEMARLGLGPGELAIGPSATPPGMAKLVALYPRLEVLFSTVETVPELRELLLSLATLAEKRLSQGSQAQTAEVGHTGKKVLAPQAGSKANRKIVRGKGGKKRIR